LDDITEKIWDDTYDVIVKGAFFLTKLAIPHLKKSGEGVILFTSSSSAGTSVPVDPHYMTAKNAVNLLYKILTGWLAPDIRVNCIIPGLIKTHMFRHHPPEVWEAFRNTLPMGRMGTPMDIAHAALFLCSPEANYLTGVAIPVDGGRTAATPRKAIMSSVTKMKAGETRYDESLYSEEDLKDIEVGL
jgi:3-oxoacyl-[acyl-carrier protein] reductase